MPDDTTQPRGRTENPEQVITEMCEIRKTVNEHFRWHHAADCICAGVRETKYFRDDGPVTEFIRAAVAEKIAREKGEAVRKTHVRPNTVRETEVLAALAAGHSRPWDIHIATGAVHRPDTARVLRRLVDIGQVVKVRYGRYALAGVS